MATGRAYSPRRMHFVRAGLIGVCAGALAVAFRQALAASENGRERLLKNLHENHPDFGWLVLPVIGLAAGCLVGWMTQRFSPDAAGSGIPHLKGVMLHVRKLAWVRLVVVKFIGGVLGIGAGLSLGREGPTVQMGASMGKALAPVLRAPQADMPQLLSAGAGAGLAAAFNAPLAGLLFVVEELHRELSSRTAAGALVAAVCATVVTQAFTGDTPSFEVRGLEAMPLAALPLAVVIGVLGGMLGVAFNRALLVTQSAVIAQQRVPRWALPGAAAALAGLAAWWLPGAVGGGHHVAEQVLGGTIGMGLGALMLLIAAKLALTAISYASGAPGGIFAPMLLLGALCGAVCAHVAALTSPELAGLAQVLAVLGMAAVFVGSVRTPLTGIVLISEMTGGYRLLFPICVASLSAYMIAEWLREPPIYDALLERDLHRLGLGPAMPEPRTVYIGIQSRSAMAGKAIAKAGLPAGCLIVAVERGGASLLPTAGTVLLPGDHISILAPGDAPEAPLEIVRLCTGM